MSNTWFISDPHFGHRNIITFKDAEGELMRPFQSIEEHDETIIENFNSLVHPKDRVYVMGDVAIHRRNIQTVSRLNGRKKLIRGNHDIFGLKDYSPYFEDLVSYRIYPHQGIIFSHIPIHTCQLQHRFKWNVHGHTHSHLVKRESTGEVDKRYINLCLEHTGFKPVSFDEICERIGWEKNKK